jgi:serine O-acetyltransferase
MIKKDLDNYANTLFGKIKVIFFSFSFHIVLVYRLSSFFYNNIPFIGNLIGVLIEYFNRVLFSVDISRKSKIGEGFVIIHGMGIVIGDNVVIGKNCKIFNGVNLGNKNTEININYQPMIGDNVVIGTGAKCLGDIKIGNNVKIGANAVVLDDVPDNCVAVGIPAKITKKDL